MNKCLDNSLKQGQQKWEGDKEREREREIKTLIKRKRVSRG